MEVHLTQDGTRFVPTAKLCRLCGDEVGPFLDVFGTNVNLSLKMAKILPFEVDQHDNLPQTICYLCSAKVTEFYDFLERCTRTRENLLRVLRKPKSKSPNKYADAFGLKDLTVRVTRIEDERRSSDSLSNFNVLNVTGYGAVYTCKTCERLLMREQIHQHQCRGKPPIKGDLSTPPPTALGKRVREPSVEDDSPSLLKIRKVFSCDVVHGTPYLSDESSLLTVRKVCSNDDFRRSPAPKTKRPHSNQIAKATAKTTRSRQPAAIQQKKSVKLNKVKNSPSVSQTPEPEKNFTYRLPQTSKDSCISEKGVVEHLSRLKNNLESIFKSGALPNILGNLKAGSNTGVVL